MKKIVILSLLLVFLFTLNAFSLDDKLRLVDDADLFSAGEEQRLNQKLSEKSEEYGVDFVIAAFDSINGREPQNYISFYFDQMDYGIGEEKNGVILLFAMQEREYCILSNGDIGSGAISDSDIDYICDKIFPSVKNGQYFEACEIFIDECDYRISGEVNGYPFDAAKNLLISLVIGLVIALISTGIMRAGLKSVRKQNFASNYVKEGSFNLTLSRDLFLYRTISRERKSSSSGSSSASGSSRNVGGRSF